MFGIFRSPMRGGLRGVALTTSICAILVGFGSLQAAQMPKLKVDTNSIPRNTAQVTSYAPVVSNVSPSVVSVYTRKTVRGGGVPFLQDPMLRRFFGFDGRPRREQALGSGVIVSEDGYIFTNSHVVEGADEIQVQTVDGREFTAKLIGSDPPTDVAIIKVEGTNLPAATLADSSNVRVGDIVLALGNPFGVGQTVTMGIVSATERSGLGITEYEDFIQTDASINPGNSGGPLVDAQGRVVALSTAIFSRSGGNMGIGFAVPISLAQMIMNQIITEGRVVRGFLGVSVQTLTPELARQFKVPNTRGALVGSVSPNTPAARAGIQEGDVITSINNQPVESSRALRMMISQMKPGAEVKVTLLRNGQNQTVTAKVGELPKQQQRRASRPDEGEDQDQRGQTSSVLEGVELQTLDNQLRQEIQAPRNLRGVVVAGIDDGSAAYEAGLRPGDVITEVDRKKVTSLEQFEATAQKEKGDALLLRVWSEDGYHYLTIPMSKK